jgi:hypothetical protein
MQNNAMGMRNKELRAKRFIGDLQRLSTLFLTTVVAGGTRVRNVHGSTRIVAYWWNERTHFHPLRQVDKRELTEAIFFEAAAKFEEFAFDAFLYSVRKRFKVSATKADYIMGNPDSGTKRVAGWASIPLLKSRGLNLLGAKSFFARLDNRLNPRLRKLLDLAHLLRNRIAHEGGASKKLLSLMQHFGVPKSQMPGMIPGRFLLEYPPSTRIPSRMIYVLIFAYARFAQQWKRYA